MTSVHPIHTKTLWIEGNSFNYFYNTNRVVTIPFCDTIKVEIKDNHLKLYYKTYRVEYQFKDEMEARRIKLKLQLNGVIS